MVALFIAAAVTTACSSITGTGSTPPGRAAVVSDSQNTEDAYTSFVMSHYAVVKKLSNLNVADVRAEVPDPTPRADGSLTVRMTFNFPGSNGETIEGWMDVTVIKSSDGKLGIADKIRTGSKYGTGDDHLY